MAHTSPDPLDRHVGHRLKQARRAEGLTQSELARPLGIAAQQLQRYEKGVGKIGAVRLYRLARLLDVPVQYFFDGLSARSIGNGPLVGRPAGERKSVLSIEGERAAAALLADFHAIGDQGVQAALRALARALRRGLMTGR